MRNISLDSILTVVLKPPESWLKLESSKRFLTMRDYSNWLSLDCSSGIDFKISPDDSDVQPHWSCLVYHPIWSSNTDTVKTSSKSINSTSDYLLNGIICNHFHLCLVYGHVGNSISFYNWENKIQGKKWIRVRWLS